MFTIRRLLLISGSLTLSPLLCGLDDTARHPRTIGMGGATVATTTDREAQKVNPAALARYLPRVAEAAEPPPPQWMIPIEIHAGALLGGDMQELLEQIETVDRLAELANDNALTAQDARAAVNLVAGLAQLSSERISANIGGGASGAVRWRNWMLGAAFDFDSAGFLSDVDLVNLGLAGVDTLTDALQNEAATIIGQVPAGYQIQTLDAEQLGQLAAAGYTTDGIKAIDAVLTSKGIGSEAVSMAVEGLAAVPVAELTSLDNNTTSVRLSALALVDIPLSYGHPINDWLDVGATLHYYHGRVYGLDVSVFDEDERESFINEDDPHEDSDTFGIDLGFAARWRDFRFGLAGRNLNTPTFDGFKQGGLVTIPDVELEPRVIIGAAWTWRQQLTLEVDFDILQHEDIDSVDRQPLRIGVEWNPLGWSILSLRGGVQIDTQDDTDTLDDILYSLGMGLGRDTWNFELAVGISPETVTFDDNEYPVSLGVALGFSGGF